jgi:aldehyde:ferredoxin oxidoreductase
MSRASVVSIQLAKLASSVMNMAWMHSLSVTLTVVTMALFDIGAITEKDRGGHQTRIWFGTSISHYLKKRLMGEGFGKDITMGLKKLTQQYGLLSLSMSVICQQVTTLEITA